MPKVKVRVAVAVDPTGSWNACGFSGAKDDKDKMDLCVEMLEDGEARYWLEAELDVPEVPTVKATVLREGGVE